MQYVYPAVLKPDSELEDWYLISFPDLKGCATETGDLYHALFSAARILNEFLEKLEDSGAEIPPPTDIKSVKIEGDEIVTLIKADTDAHRLLNAKFAAL